MKIKIVGKTSPSEAWTVLKSYHQGKSRSDIQRRRRELENLRFKDFPSMTAFLDKVKSMAKQLETMSAEMEEDDIIILILDKLPYSLKHAAAAIRSEREPNKRSHDEVIKYLIDEAEIEEAHQRRRNHGRSNTNKDKDGESEAAFSVRNGRGKKANDKSKAQGGKSNDFECRRCGQKGAHREELPHDTTRR